MQFLLFVSTAEVKWHIPPNKVRKKKSPILFPASQDNGDMWNIILSSLRFFILSLLFISYKVPEQQRGGI